MTAKQMSFCATKQGNKSISHDKQNYTEENYFATKPTPD